MGLCATCVKLHYPPRVRFAIRSSLFAHPSPPSLQWLPSYPDLNLVEQQLKDLHTRRSERAERRTASKKKPTPGSVAASPASQCDRDRDGGSSEASSTAYMPFSRKRSASTGAGAGVSAGAGYFTGEDEEDDEDDESYDEGSSEEGERGSEA